MNNSKLHLRFVEGLLHEESRKVLILKKVKIEDEAEGLVLEIDPPLSGRKYGFDCDMISSLVVSARYSDESLSPMSQLPITVYIFISLEATTSTDNYLRKSELKKIAFGEIYIEGELDNKPVIVHRVNPL